MSEEQKSPRHHADLQWLPEESLLLRQLPEEGLVEGRTGPQELVQGGLLRRGHRLEGWSLS